MQMPRGGPYRDWERPGSVTFFLTAPFKPAVHLVGDFNGWDSRAMPMETDGAGRFWLSVPFSGTAQYRFVVTIDGSGRRVWVADPYAREIRWDVRGPKAVIAGDPPFEWRDAAWRRPPLRDLVIYELCVRDFSGTRRGGLDHFGDFAGVQAKLDHLGRLGVNAIELMPVSEFPGDSSWGYNPVFYMAPKWIYGAPSDLKALIDAAHQRGIAVIVDMVFNHAWPDHPYYRMYPPLFGLKGEILEDLNPFFHHHSNGHANSWGGLDWDHASPYTTAYMQDVVRYWLEAYHIDGFRFDWLGGVEYDPWQPDREGFDPFCGIAPIARVAREAAPDCYLIGEYWPIHGTNPGKTAARLVRQTDIDAVWNDAFHHVLENCLFETWQWELQDLPHAFGGFGARGFERADQVVNYVVSHDERRPEHELQYWRPHVQPIPEPWDAAEEACTAPSAHDAREGLSPPSDLLSAAPWRSDADRVSRGDGRPVAGSGDPRSADFPPGGGLRPPEGGLRSPHRTVSRGDRQFVAGSGATSSGAPTPPAPAGPLPVRWQMALQKAKLGLAVLLTSPGIPMLLAGQEFGDDSPRTIEFCPLSWDKLIMQAGREHFEYTGRLIDIRQQHPALRSDHIEFYLDDFEMLKVLRYKRWDGDGDVAVVAANFDRVRQTVGLGFPRDGGWEEAVSGEVFEVEGHWREFALPPWSAVILTPARR